MYKNLCLALGVASLEISCASSQHQIAQQVVPIGNAGEVKVIELTQAKDLSTGDRLIRFKFSTSSSNPQQVYWRCEFFDANGFIVEEPQRFVEATIMPQQATPETCTYPTTTAVDFKINFQNISTNMTVYH